MKTILLYLTERTSSSSTEILISLFFFFCGVFFVLFMIFILKGLQKNARKEIISPLPKSVSRVVGLQSSLIVMIMVLFLALTEEGPIRVTIYWPDGQSWTGWEILFVLILTFFTLFIGSFLFPTVVAFLGVLLSGNFIVIWVKSFAVLKGLLGKSRVGFVWLEKQAKVRDWWDQSLSEPLLVECSETKRGLLEKVLKEEGPFSRMMTKDEYLSLLQNAMEKVAFFEQEKSALFGSGTYPISWLALSFLGGCVAAIVGYFSFSWFFSSGDSEELKTQEVSQKMAENLLENGSVDRVSEIQKEIRSGNSSVFFGEVQRLERCLSEKYPTKEDVRQMADEIAQYYVRRAPLNENQKGGVKDLLLPTFSDVDSLRETSHLYWEDVGKMTNGLQKDVIEYKRFSDEAFRNLWLQKKKQEHLEAASRSHYDMISGQQARVLSMEEKLKKISDYLELPLD